MNRCARSMYDWIVSGVMLASRSSRSYRSSSACNWSAVQSCPLTACHPFVVCVDKGHAVHQRTPVTSLSPFVPMRITSFPLLVLIFPIHAEVVPAD